MEIIGELASDDVVIPVDSLNIYDIVRDAGKIISMKVDWSGKTYMKTITRVAGEITETGVWVLQ